MNYKIFLTILIVIINVIYIGVIIHKLGRMNAQTSILLTSDLSTIEKLKCYKVIEINE